MRRRPAAPPPGTTYRRVGVQVNDSSQGDYFHRTAEITKPISDRLLDVISEKEI